MMEYFPIKYKTNLFRCTKIELKKNLFDLRYTKFNEYRN